MVSARELADAFTPAGDEVVWARGKTTTEPHTRPAGAVRGSRRTGGGEPDGQAAPGVRARPAGREVRVRAGARDCRGGDPGGGGYQGQSGRPDQRGVGGAGPQGL